MKTITVLLADDHRIFREGLRSLLKRERDLEVVGEAETGREAVRLARKLLPDVVLMDIGMPLLNGIEAARQIRNDLPGTSVLILSAHCDYAYLEQAAELGAAGFLIKQTSCQILADAIRGAKQGDSFFTPAVAQRIRDCCPMSVDREGSLKKRINHLSSREVEVLQMISEGHPNKQIAAELGVSFKTVDKHRQHLMAKLNIHDVAGLTRYAIGEGIIESSVQV